MNWLYLCHTSSARSTSDSRGPVTRKPRSSGQERVRGNLDHDLRRGRQSSPESLSGPCRRLRYHEYRDPTHKVTKMRPHSKRIDFTPFSRPTLVVKIKKTQRITEGNHFSSVIISRVFLHCRCPWRGVNGHIYSAPVGTQYSCFGTRISVGRMLKFKIQVFFFCRGAQNSAFTRAIH